MLIIINYNNLKSEPLQQVLKDLQVEYKLSDNEYEIFKAEKLILPGYGAAAEGIKKIHLLNLFTILRVIKKPVLGIGLGMEVLCDYSTEGNVSCLGIVGSKVEKFNTEDSEVPFHGFHPVDPCKETPLLKGISAGEEFYFDNSYYLPINQYSTASSKNNQTLFSAAIERGNYYGVQFHPEQSGESGLKVINNFLDI